jgi:bacterioferritin (cytochrome b1)
MKGNSKVIAFLNFALADELTAVSQYMVHLRCARTGDTTGWQA